MPEKFIYVTAKELGTCPAAVNMYDGTIEINRDVWNWFTSFEKKFIIEHEKGHYRLQTDDESEADKYALQKVYGTAPRSLKKSIETLYKVGISDDDRLKKLYVEALKIDWNENSNKTAFEELKEISTNMKTKQITTGSPLARYNKVTGNAPKKTKKAKRNRADGEDVETPETPQKGAYVCQSKSHKTNGMKVGGYYFSFTNVLLAVSIIVLIVIASRLKLRG